MIGLTATDEEALVRLLRSTTRPLEIVHIKSHFRFHRLWEKRLVATFQPRLTPLGLSKAEAAVKEHCK